MNIFWGKLYFCALVLSFAGNSVFPSEAEATRISSSNNNRFGFETRGVGSSGGSSSGSIRDRDDDYDSDLISPSKEPTKHKGSIDFRVFSSQSKENCPSELGNRCECGYAPDKYDRQRKKYVVDCTDTGFSDVKVLEHLPDEIEHLIFVGNNIPVLPQNIFGSKNYTNLKEINMSSNGIREVKGKSFHHVNFVERLILSNNHISKQSIQDHPRVFSNFYNLKELHLTAAFDKDIWLLSDLAEIFLESNLTKLRKLHIEQNNVEVITNGTVFCELPSLWDLHISQNKLTDVNVDISCLPHLRYIDASFNKIREVAVNSGLYRLLGEYARRPEFKVELYGNPFNCDCNLDEYLQWFHNWTIFNADRVPHHENLRCETGIPESNVNMYIKDVKTTECPVMKASQYSSSAATTIVWILGIIAVIAVLTFAYSHRVAIFQQVTPLLQSTPHGVKYTSIEKNEEAEIAHV